MAEVAGAAEMVADALKVAETAEVDAAVTQDGCYKPNELLSHDRLA